MAKSIIIDKREQEKGSIAAGDISIEPDDRSVDFELDLAALPEDGKKYLSMQIRESIDGGNTWHVIGYGEIIGSTPMDKSGNPSNRYVYNCSTGYIGKKNRLVRVAFLADEKVDFVVTAEPKKKNTPIVEAMLDGLRNNGFVIRGSLSDSG